MRKHLLGVSVFLAAMSLTACGPSLGVFDGDDGYDKLYDSFGDVKALYDGGDHTYDIEDSILNEKTVNEFQWKDGDEVKKEEYVYIIMPVEANLDIECIILFFQPKYSHTLEFSLFYFKDEDETPKKIKYLSSPDYETDEEGNPKLDEHGEPIPIEYDDPPKEKRLVGGSLSIGANSWDNYVYGDFKQDGYDDGLLHVKDDGLIYLRIENNSGFNRDILQSVEFTFVNLMVRAV